ncbi:MAG: tyrosine-type recombinase/integrase [Lachnospiraceae bacterium]|jgi:integrase|nr:tyrosine-type recombinase/integrase [Lachnospiraceae bacterium]
MSTTQPIRNLENLERLKNYFLTECPNLRHYLLVHLSVNTALRISDILSLTWEDVYDFYHFTFREHLILTEKKTKKRKQIPLNENLVESLTSYMQSYPVVLPKNYLFFGRNVSHPLSRSQAFRILKTASENLHFEDPVSCHSLRKTFGYHAWQAGVTPVMLMNIYNHSSYQITKRYLGIEQKEIDDVFLNIKL